MGPKNCKVCDDAQSKYKCPNCFIPYCSLVCFKKHKASAPESHVEKRPIYVDEQSEVLNQSRLESIASSHEIREAIRNKELQNLICCIDSSMDAEAEFDKAMDKEEFRIFSEKILSMISQ